MRILWVDNHAGFVRMASQQFLRGHELTVVATLAAARHALATQRFDAVLLDYDLDDGKGNTLLDPLRALPRRVPVIAVSARPEGNTALLQAGADAACAKLQFAEIAHVLQRVLPAPYLDSMMDMQRIKVLDSHTGGEPTRVIVEGGPNLGSGSFVERRAIFRDRYDWIRTTVINEPRGSDVLVGALLCEPTDPTCCAGVIFFNNACYLGMCGHGTIGVVVTLGHLGRIGAGTHKLETPVGIVTFEYDGAHRVQLDNVPCYRAQADVGVDVPGIGRVVGDIAWGGNWFFLIGEHGLPLHVKHVEQLTGFTWRVRQALQQQGITGTDGAEIDHIELFGPPVNSANDSRNFVLCPGKAYDRSPCGTGTSAKLACLHARGKIAEGDVWRQESIIGSVFEGSVRIVDGQVIPRITGTAYMTAETTLLLDPQDPFRTGIPS